MTFTQRVRPPGGGGGAPVIGEGRNVSAEQQPPAGGSKPPPPRPRYAEAPGPGARPMPRVYRPNSLVAYWYVPLAAVLAIAVAVGVVWAADRLFGDDGSPAAAGDNTPTPQATRAGSGPTAPAGQATNAPGGATTPGAATPAGAATATRAPGDNSLRVGDRAVVTGAGDCLNVRVAAGRTNDAIVCLADGQEVTVTGGPVATDGFVWWKVMTFLGEGWAVDEYLVRKP
jgi:hypothetical protein